MDKAKEDRFTWWEVIIFVIVFLGIFLISFVLLVPLLMNPPLDNILWFYGPTVLLIVLGVTLLWTLVMKLLFRKDKENIVTKREVIIFAVTFLGIYCSFFCCWPSPLKTGGLFMEYCLSSPIGPLVILAFDVGWCFIMKLLFKKYRKARIFFILLVLTVSVALLVGWIINQMISDMKFG